MPFTDLAAPLEAAGRALPMLALKAALLLSAAGVLALTLRRRSAAARHLVWATAMAGVLVLPLVQLLPVTLPVLPASLTAGTPAAGLPASGGEPTVVARPMVAAAASEPGRAEARPPLDRAALLVLAWAVGAALLLLRLGIGTGTAWWLARRGERIQDEGWTLAADRISRAFDAPSARLVRSRWTEMPMTWGFVRPVVLLPADCDSWPAERRDVVLRHELAHVARRDVLTLALAELARAVHWFNPLSWLALHQLRAEAERCCDDWVLSNGTRASTYAGHLLEMVRIIGRSRVPVAVALPMAQRSTFEGRLLAILEPGIERGAPPRRALATAGAVIVLVLALGAMTPAAPAAAPAPEAPASGAAAATPDPAPSPLPGRVQRPERPAAAGAAVAGDAPRPAAGAVKPKPASAGDTLTLDQLIAMRAVGVTPAYASQMRSLFGRVTADEIVSLRAVGVTPEFVAELRRLGYTGLRAGQVTGMRAVGVDAAYVEALRAAGYPRLTVEQLTSMRAVGVTPEWLAEMARLGYRDLPQDDLTGMRAVGVDADYVRAMNAAGYGRLTADQLTSLRALGVTPGYLEEMARAGLRAASVDEVAGMRAVGVTPAYVAELRTAGLEGLGVETLTSLRALGVTGAYIRGLSESGLRNLSVDDLTELRAHGVTPEYIRELEAAGFGPLTTDQLIRLRASGADRDLLRSRRRDPK